MVQTRNTSNSRKRYSPDINLNLNVRGLGQSATLEINELSAELIRQGREVFRMGLGQSPFPVPQVVVDELKVNAHQKAYLPVKGLETLRTAVAEYHHRHHGIDHSADNVLIGPGSKELMFILQLVYYGDLVIPTPSWVSYAPQAHIIGRHIRWLPTCSTNCWKVTPEEIERLCESDPQRPRIIILNYPNNPSGCSFSASELKKLARTARKYRVVLLSDEIYGELHHEGHHVSIAKFYPEGTIISSGLSKWCGAGGWRLGTFLFPDSLKWLLNAMAVVASETYTASSAPIQFAAIRAFNGGLEIEDYLQRSRKVLRALGRSLASRLKEAGVRISQPQGAFYLFPDFDGFREQLRSKGIENSVQLSTRLLEETGIAVLPGSSFGCDPELLTVRMAYVDFDGARALAATREVPLAEELSQEFLQFYCGGPIEAVNRLGDWLSELSA
ncbi:MAG: pyridoxal phosphate-dependent aminotransferase [Acidobacteriota bacterium]|nr:MAG: pyridoxal phosphate-dependent aminotransferase [Acidobacteriota bacterium]